MDNVTALPGAGRVPEHAQDPTNMPPWRNTAAKGAASELVACVYLLRQGWHVFRSQSSSCPFDLVAYRDGTFCRVEVKSINWGSALRKGPSVAWPTNDEWDLLLVVDPDDGDCTEITDHDPLAGRNLIRAKFGFDALERRRTREELRAAL